MNGRLTRSHRPTTHLQDFVQRVTVNVDSAVTDTGLMGMMKNLAGPVPTERETVFCCVPCLRPVKGSSSHLFVAHRAVMLIEWGAVTVITARLPSRFASSSRASRRTPSYTPSRGSALEEASVSSAQRRNRRLRDTRRFLLSLLRLSASHRCLTPASVAR